jgi:hypothetical protein
MRLELQQRKNALEKERMKIIELAKKVMILSEEITSFDGEIINFNAEPYSVETISQIVDKWKFLNAESIKWIENKKGTLIVIPS